MERKFERYDHGKLERAKSLLLEVYWYYYSAPGYSRLVKRLRTIILKLETLQQIG